MNRFFKSFKISPREDMKKWLFTHLLCDLQSVWSDVHSDSAYCWHVVIRVISKNVTMTSHQTLLVVFLCFAPSQFATWDGLTPWYSDSSESPSFAYMTWRNEWFIFYTILTRFKSSRLLFSWLVQYFCKKILIHGLLRPESMEQTGLEDSFWRS